MPMIMITARMTVNCDVNNDDDYNTKLMKNVLHRKRGRYIR